jgi:hypothetical protein
MYRCAPTPTKLAPKASLWRRFLAWRRGTFVKMEMRRIRALLRHPTPSMIDAVMPDYLKKRPLPGPNRWMLR